MKNRGFKKHRKNNEITKILSILVGVLVAVIGIVVVVTVLNPEERKSIKNEEVEEIEIIEKEDILEFDYSEINKIQSLITEKQINAIEAYDEYAGYDDYHYKGIVQFQSGLISEPFVQSVDNDVYLRRDWITGEYAVMGSIFMDYECSLDSQNIVLYGHNAFSTYYAGTDKNGNELVNDELMFTPLKFLTNVNNYDANKTVNLILKDERREYKIVSVYYCPLTGEGDNLYPDVSLQYYLSEFSDDYFKEYKNRIDQVEFYDTGVDYTNEDKFLTLQTCVEGNSMVREIVLCKEVNRIALKRDAYNQYVTKLEDYNKRKAEYENLTGSRKTEN